jgi:hypothetical protein
MASYYIEVEKKGDQWVAYLWRSTWLGGSNIIMTQRRNTKSEIDLVAKLIKENKDKYIKEYEDGLSGHQYIPL